MAETTLKYSSANSRSRRIGLKEVARAANVSVAAVSMALADHPSIGTETKRRIWQLCAELGYQPKDRQRYKAKFDRPVVVARRSLKRAGFMLLGASLHDPACGSILQNLMSSCADAGIALQVAAVEPADFPAAAPERTLALARDIDGLILMGMADTVLLTALNVAGVPYVVLGYTMTTPQEALELRVHVIATDDVAMGQTATQVLIDNGHRRIGFICEVLPRGMSHWRWRDGYAIAHLGAGLPVSPELIHVSGKIYDTGDAAAEAMLKLDDSPTAFVVPDSRIAASFLAAMERRGIRVPRDCVVIGADPATVARYDVGEYPLIEYDPGALVAMGLKHLQRAYEDPSPCALTLHVPFAYRNLPLRRQ